MALGQQAEPQQTQGQTNDQQTTAPAKGKKTRPEQEANKPQAKPETGTNVRGQPQTNVKGRHQGRKNNEPAGSFHSETRDARKPTNVNEADGEQAS
jgi:hypothetical protein